MHEQARHFTLFIKEHFGDYFTNKYVLDVGAGDINGNNRFLFNNCIYEGNDVIHASNVTVVSKTKDLPFEDETFDTIVSTECFEHDPEYKASFQKIYRMLKPGGLFFFTCASTGRPEHGTMNANPCDSFGTIGNIPDMINYYKNLTIVDVNEAINLNDCFEVWDSYYSPMVCDLYFVGIKKGGDVLYSIPHYMRADVQRTAGDIIV
jgi:SAM-dependent methyltransferase